MRTASASLIPSTAQALQKSPPSLCASPEDLPQWIPPATLAENLCSWRKLNRVSLDRSQSSRKGKRERRKAHVCTHLGGEGKPGPWLNSTEISWGMGSSSPCCYPRESKGNTEKGKQQGALHGHQNLLNWQIYTDQGSTAIHCSSSQARKDIKMTQSRLWHRHSPDTSYLLDRQTAKAEHKLHSQSSPVLAQIVHISYQPKNTTAHKVEKLVSLFFHLPKGIEEFHSCNGNWTKITLSPFKSSNIFV